MYSINYTNRFNKDLKMFPPGGSTCDALEGTSVNP
jgi:hypothetical protein